MLFTAPSKAPFVLPTVKTNASIPTGLSFNQKYPLSLDTQRRSSTNSRLHSWHPPRGNHPTPFCSYASTWPRKACAGQHLEALTRLVTTGTFPVWSPQSSNAKESPGGWAVSRRLGCLYLPEKGNSSNNGDCPSGFSHAITSCTFPARLSLLPQQVAFYREFCCLAGTISALRGTVRKANSE